MDQPTRDWQELCEAASKEPDPKKLMSLIAEIITMLNDRRRKSARVPNAQNFEGGSCASLHSAEMSQDPACESSVSL